MLRDSFVLAYFGVFSFGLYAAHVFFSPDIFGMLFCHGLWSPVPWIHTRRQIPMFRYNRGDGQSRSLCYFSKRKPRKNVLSAFLKNHNAPERILISQKRRKLL
ncbi:hypothetical protein, partial [Methanocorpusculum vombati]